MTTLPGAFISFCNSSIISSVPKSNSVCPVRSSLMSFIPTSVWMLCILPRRPCRPPRPTPPRKVPYFKLPQALPPLESLAADRIAPQLRHGAGVGAALPVPLAEPPIEEAGTEGKQFVPPLDLAPGRIGIFRDAACRPAISLRVVRYDLHGEAVAAHREAEMRVAAMYDMGTHCNHQSSLSVKSRDHGKMTRFQYW